MFRVTRFKGEGSVTDLVERLFKFEGGGKGDRAQAAADALLEANPQLNDLKSLPVGTFIIVPEVEDAAFARASKPFAAEELTKHLGRAIEGLRIAFDAQTARRAESAQETLELLKMKEVKAAARNNPDVKDQVGEATKDAKAQLKGVKETEKARDEAFEQMSQHLEGILKALG